MFVLRQINNKINTTVVSMTVICLMLFLTISVLSTALGIRETMQRELIEMTPVDINLEKRANLPEVYKNEYEKEKTSTKEQREDSKISIYETLKNNKLDMSVLKDVIEIPIYTSKGLTVEKFLSDKYESINERFPRLMYRIEEEIIKVSDYNKIARLYGLQEYSLNENEYIVLCEFDNQTAIRNEPLADKNNILEIAGKEYNTKYNECKEGFIEMSTSHTNTGIILVPDSCPLTSKMQSKYFLVANYNSNTEEGKAEIEKNFVNGESDLIQSLDEKGINIDGLTKISLVESSVGLATIVIFIAIYLGVIFLIASSAILALKQLTESSDNKERYIILRKIGCDEKMINSSLFKQIGIFFILPLILAIVHSIFGIKFGLRVLNGLLSPTDILPSIIVSAIVITVIYGAYFIATYIESKRIISQD